MSSPGARLKRTRRTPLIHNSNHGVPFRIKDDPSTSTSVSSLPNLPTEADTHILPLRRHKEKEVRKGRSVVPSDNNLVSSMAARLAIVESELLSARREIIEKDIQIRELKECLSLKTSSSEMESRYKSLQKQVHEMEEFLSDYGMTWVGEDSIDHSHSDSTWYPDSSLSQRGVVNIDYDKIVRNISELNILAGVDTSIVTRTHKGAVLKQPDSVQLTLYKNGLVMFSGPFRPYTDPTTQQCIQDLMDGFFPSELQTQYPEGIPFNLTDKRSEIYHSSHHYIKLFPGEGQKLMNPISHKPHPSPDQYHFPHPYKSKRQHSHKHSVTVDQFLSRIPKHVIKGGHVIDVHTGITETLQGTPPKSMVRPVKTPVLQESNDRFSHIPIHNEMTTLRIRTENGDQIMLKMRIDDTIDKLKEHIDQLRSHDFGSHDQYMIKTAFPCKTYSDTTATLRSCGLFPSANIFISPVTNSN